MCSHQNSLFPSYGKSSLYQAWHAKGSTPNFSYKKAGHLSQEKRIASSTAGIFNTLCFK